MITLTEFYSFVNDATIYFARPENVDCLLEAQKEYGHTVRKISKEDPNYDLCMMRFYEWYLFDYCKNDGDKKHIEVFLEVKGGNEEIAEVLQTVKPSIFEFYGTRLFRKNIFKNLQTGEVFQLASDHPEMIFFDHDLLLGHAGVLNGQYFFLEGVTTLSRKARKIILRESKRVKKMKDEYKMRHFLYQLEQHNLRYEHYQHVTPDKIFTFFYE